MATEQHKYTQNTLLSHPQRQSTALPLATRSKMFNNIYPVFFCLKEGGGGMKSGGSSSSTSSRFSCPM